MSEITTRITKPTVPPLLPRASPMTEGMYNIAPPIQYCSGTSQDFLLPSLVLYTQSTRGAHNNLQLWVEEGLTWIMYGLVVNRYDSRIIATWLNMTQEDFLKSNIQSSITIHLYRVKKSWTSTTPEGIRNDTEGSLLTISWYFLLYHYWNTAR